MSLYGSEIAYKKKKTLQHVLTAIIQGPTKGALRQRLSISAPWTVQARVSGSVS